MGPGPEFKESLIFPWVHPLHRLGSAVHALSCLAVQKPSGSAAGRSSFSAVAPRGPSLRMGCALPGVGVEGAVVTLNPGPLHSFW